MIEYLKLIVASLFITGLSACYKDTKTCRCARETKFNLKNECRNVDQYIYPPPIGPMGISDLWLLEYHPDNDRFTPCFNPLNEQEIAYVFKDRRNNNDTSINPHVVLANLVTGEHRFLSFLNSKQQGAELKWHENGYILVGHTLNKVINVDSLNERDLSLGVTLANPVWNANGTKVFGWKFLISNSKFDKLLLNEKIVSVSWPDLKINPTGLLKDFEVYRQATDLSRNGHLLYSTGFDGGLHFVDIETNETELIFKSKVKIGKLGNSYDWSPNGGKLFFVNKDDGIFFIKNGENKQYRIKKSCPNRQYLNLTISPSGDKLIAERKDINAERDGTYISQKHNLVIMDIDGCNEKVLFEDWDGTVVGRP